MSAKVPVVLSYGMTETAAMIAAQLPADFAAGARNVGRAMPHVRLDLLDEEGLSGDGAREVGRIRVAGRSVHLGYFPAFDLRQELVTEDLGRFEAGGALQVLGRRDAVIISGGEKISPAEVEEVLRSLGVFADIAVIGVPDPVWGQAVVACHPASGGEKAPSLEDVRAALGERLAAFKQPKHLFALAEWPRNAQGKLNRTALLAQALLALGRR
jgi:O-succinylbenzoic acid--CoA ligase